MLSVIFFLLLGILVYLQRLPLTVLLCYGLLSCLAFYLYGCDKSAAKIGQRRTRESTLHWVGLLGGWPGALVAQRFFHHKSRKTSFQVIFWSTVITNSALLVWVAAS